MKKINSMIIGQVQVGTARVKSFFRKSSGSIGAYRLLALLTFIATSAYAAPHDGTVLLNRKVTAEHQNDHYLVQRSSDGVSYKPDRKATVLKTYMIVSPIGHQVKGRITIV